MTEEERIAILKWVTNKQNPREINNKKYTITLGLSDNTVPLAVWKIKRRLIEKEGLHECRQDHIFGDMVLIISNGGILQPHTDPSGLIDNAIHCRFNVFIQMPKNLDTYYAGYLIQAKERHYVMCRSGMDLHWSTTNTDDLRITLSFGYLLPRKMIDKIYQIPTGIIKTNDIIKMNIFSRFSSYCSQAFRSWRHGY